MESLLEYQAGVFAMDVGSCSMYVDLNQVKAGQASSLIDSEHSSIRRRILAAKQREAEESRRAFAREERSEDYAFPASVAELVESRAKQDAHRCYYGVTFCREVFVFISPGSRRSRAPWVRKTRTGDGRAET